jgi:hypothetical protein
MTRGIKETHSNIIGGADDTGRKGVMPNVPALAEVIFKADAAISVGVMFPIVQRIFHQIDRINYKEK